ncbi:MAG: PBP1A family penicillin-binding protein [Nitrospirae bacterium]|nr:PBP1A family penicillin-binding protein [Nitrospirota bacterium]
MKKVCLFIKLLTLSLIVGAGVFYFTILKDIPPVEVLKKMHPPQGTKVYASDNVLIGEFKIYNGRYIKLKDIPSDLINAVIATEDSRFFKHRGVDYLAITRALIKDIIHMSFKEGGSTITQQLAKMLYLSHEKTIKRKIKEAIIAFKLERNLQKEEILELYLNRAYFGSGAYGVEDASRLYFGKSVKRVNIKEAALLAGLLKAPNLYSPYRDLNRAEARARVVLSRMEHEGYLKPSERRYAETIPLKLKSLPEGTGIYGYFLSYIRDYLEDKYGIERVYKGGLKVYTTLRRWAQIQAQKRLSSGIEAVDLKKGWRGPLYHIDNIDIQRELKRTVSAEMIRGLKGENLKATVLRVYNNRAILKVNGAYGILKRTDALWAMRGKRAKGTHSLTQIISPGDVIIVKLLKIQNGIAHVALSQEPEVEGALVAIEPKTGYIIAMTGGYDYRRTQFNRAVKARRQAGSAFKPFIYALALEKGLTAATHVKDVPVTYQLGNGRLWKPQNYDRKFHGVVTLREALTESLNIATLKIAERLPFSDIIDFAIKLGFKKEDIPRDLSIALGSITVSPLQLVSAYTIFVNRGYLMKPIAIKKVVDMDGKVLEFNRPAGRRVISEGTAFIITSILQDVIKKGTGRAARVPFEAAGKTGTTDNYRDAWFIGYTPSLLSGVWIGYDDGRSLGDGMTGGRVAAPVWRKFMRSVVIEDKKEGFIKPKNVVKLKINKKTGKRTLFSSSYEEYFIKGTEPGWKIF